MFKAKVKGGNALVLLKITLELRKTMETYLLITKDNNSNP